VVNRTCARGDRIIVSAFAVGRTQQLVLPLHQLANAGQIPSIPIFVDSPLTVNVTEVFRKRSECFNAETLQYLVDGQDPFGFSRLQYIREAIESKKLNDLHGPFIAISAAGIRRAINGARRHFEPGRVAHARRSGELMEWLKALAAHLKKVFPVHRRAGASAVLAGAIRSQYHN
jgi:predicted metal-dependent RNase